jgi:hypothetical protein
VADASRFLEMVTRVSNVPIPYSSIASDLKDATLVYRLSSGESPRARIRPRFQTTAPSLPTPTHALYHMKWQEKTSRENRNQDTQGKPKCAPTASHTRNQPGTKSEAVMCLMSTAFRSDRSRSLRTRHLYRTVLVAVEKNKEKKD